MKYLFIFNSFIIFNLSSILPFQLEDNQEDPSQLEDDLDTAEKNAICCKNNMKCCIRSAESSTIEIKAIMAKCSNTDEENSPNPKSSKKLSGISKHDSFYARIDEYDPLIQAEVKKCHKKILITMKISNQGVINPKPEYVVVDHVFDPETEKNTKILNPYVIKICQEPLMQMYELKYLHVVNSQAREEVYNKHDGNYSGCNIGYRKPTCGAVRYMGRVIPYSTGFCCSCDALKNSLRQPENSNVDVFPMVSDSGAPYVLGGNECPEGLRGNGISEDSGPPNLVKDDQNDTFDEELNTRGSPNEDQSRNYLHASKHYPQEMEEYSLRTKRQVQSSGLQKRGEQNCADRRTPSHLDPETYHESTHCLRFADLWYTVYQLNRPIVGSSINVQIFEKHEGADGKVKWRDISRGNVASVGTLKKHYIDEKAGLSIRYTPQNNVAFTDYAINYKVAKLLVPEGIKKWDLKSFPEASGGPEEYLVVHPSQISMDGDQCNVAGVGFEAFFKQPQRCSVPRGSCLANQPKDLWLHDHEAQEQGKKGCFFLKFFGGLPENPIMKSESESYQYLCLKYFGKHVGVVDFEVKADFNLVLRPQSSAKITEVYVDSSYPEKTVLTIKVANSGLTSSTFSTRLNDCPLDMPTNFNNIESKPVLIAPQHQHTFSLDINRVLPTERLHCSVEVLNCKQEVVALRRIRIQNLDRCICTWYCVCACMGSLEGLHCMPMSVDNYHAAGFQGSLPVITYLIRYGYIDELATSTIYIMSFMVLTLLSMGLVKAVIGLCCSSGVAMWGLQVFIDFPKKRRRSSDLDLIDGDIVNNNKKWQPSCKEKTWKISKLTAFCLNVWFFFVYPMCTFSVLMKKVCCPYYTYDSDPTETGLSSEQNFDYFRRKEFYDGGFSNQSKSNQTDEDFPQAADPE